MKWAVAQGHRTDNPAGDASSAALANNNAQRVHRQALPHAQVGAAVTKVRRSGAYRVTVLTFEFLVLTSCRSAEVRGARWDEIDLEGAVWTIPAGRMKGSRKLSHPGGFVFPSEKGRMQGHHPMGRLMKELDIGGVPHGFRSSFRDWAAECTEVPREVCELALAHVNGDRVEAAYRRSDLFERRRTLMQQWSDYLAATA